MYKMNFVHECVILKLAVDCLVFPIVQFITYWGILINFHDWDQFTKRKYCDTIEHVMNFCDIHVQII